MQHSKCLVMMSPMDLQLLPPRTLTLHELASRPVVDVFVVMFANIVGVLLCRSAIGWLCGFYF
jgi:hypothetical protein